MIKNKINNFGCGVIVLNSKNDVLYRNKSILSIAERANISIKELIKKIDTNIEYSKWNGFKISADAFRMNAKVYKLISAAADDTQPIGKIQDEMDELEAIVESSFDEIFVTDGEGYALRVNKAAEINYGIDRNQIIGKHVAELEKEGYFNPSMTLKAIRQKQRVTGVQTTNKGKTLIVTSKPVIDDSGRIIKVITNSRDITEFTNLKKQLEDSQQLIETYQNIVSDTISGSNHFISSDTIMDSILETVKKIANTTSTVLLEGESGVGKNMIAKQIHLLSKRRKHQFVTVNCGAIPDNLIESELFGYEKGAFTGAKRTGRTGLVELANHGTLFFDEIAEIPLHLQSKLLDIMQEKRFRRLGSNEYINIDIRVISATNRDLKKMVQQKLFREDLFYRLNVIPIIIPPLRGRPDTISTLSSYFLDKYNVKYRYKKKLSKDVLHLIQQYNWPGNIRELQNLIERLVVTSNSNIINVDDLPEYIKNPINNNVNSKTLDLRKAVIMAELEIFREAINRFNSTYEIARALNIDQSTVVRKMKKLNITMRKKKSS